MPVHPIAGLVLLVFSLISLILNLVFWAVVISVVLSWLIAFNVVNTRNQFVAQFAQILYRFTEKLYRPVRKVIPPFGGLDIAPMIVLIAIMFVQGSILPYLSGVVIYYFGGH